MPQRFDDNVPATIKHRGGPIWFCAGFDSLHARMHTGNRRFTDLSHRVIGCGIEVHRVLGPGLLESAYRRALQHELSIHDIRWVSEQFVPLVYKGLRIERGFRLDLFVEEQIIVEVKSIAALTYAHHAQLLTYMRLKGARSGFLMNFSQPRFVDGLVSLVL